MTGDAGPTPAGEVPERAADPPPPAHAHRAGRGEDRPRAVPGSLRRWAVASAPLALALGLGAAARAAPASVESFYSRGLYPRISAALGGLGRGWNSWFIGGSLERSHGSASEWLIAGLAVVVAALLWRSRGAGIAAVLRRCLGGAGTVYLLFLVTWGLNHARLPLAHTLGLETRPVSADELDAVAARLEEGWLGLLTATAAPSPRRSAGAAATEAWREALAREPALGASPDAAVVAPALSPLLVAAGISGIFSPLTQEAHVAAGLPEVDLLFTACHEIAHAQGWAREDEANYLAWRVASRASDPALRRAGHALALAHVHRALWRADPERYTARLLALDPRLARVFEERAAFWAGATSPAATRAVRVVNDAYLKSQGQAGVASYGRMVDLVVAEQRAEPGAELR